jgi:hypothetical protein
VSVIVIHALEMTDVEHQSPETVIRLDGLSYVKYLVGPS